MRAARFCIYASIEPGDLFVYPARRADLRASAQRRLDPLGRIECGYRPFLDLSRLRRCFSFRPAFTFPKSSRYTHAYHSEDAYLGTYGPTSTAASLASSLSSESPASLGGPWRRTCRYPASLCLPSAELLPLDQERLKRWRRSIHDGTTCRG